MSLRTISVPPQQGQAPKGLIVLMHGWGANGEDLLGLAPYLNLPEYQFLFLEAPFQHPFNPVGRMWYDLPEDYRFMGQPEFRDRPDLAESRQLITEVLKSLEGTTGVPLSHTLLGGFSQGGAMTLDVGLDFPLAGLMVLSGYLHAPPTQVTLSECSPVLMVHGRQDMVVPIASAIQSRNALQALGVPVNYQEYDMGHEIQPIVLEQIRTFVNDRLP